MCRRPALCAVQRFTQVVGRVSGKCQRVGGGGDILLKRMVQDFADTVIGQRGIERRVTGFTARRRILLGAITPARKDQVGGVGVSFSRRGDCRLDAGRAVSQSLVAATQCRG